MNEYQLTFHSMPQVCFAHRYDTNQYNSPHPVCPKLMEITYILHGESHVRKGGREYIAPCGSVLVNVYDEECSFTCSGYHYHTTIGFLVDYKRGTSGGMLLPEVLSFETEDNPIRPLLEQLVLQFTLEPDNPRVPALLFELIGKISDLYLTRLDKKQNFGKEWYVNRAKHYIINNIASPLRVTDVADYLDISSSYLGHIFTEVTGQTVTQFINTVRIKRVEELVLSYGLGLKEAGEQVGLVDPNYVSRLFKRIRGYSLSDLRHARHKNTDQQ